MAQIFINGIQNKLPLIRLDGKDYAILAGTYQRLRHEKEIVDKYSKDGNIDRNVVATGKNRWKFTLVIPADASYATARHLEVGEGLDLGDMSTILASNNKVYPYDGLYFYDLEANGIFSGSYTSYVYMRMDWETPLSNNPGIWNVPIELWGRDA